MKPRTKLQQAVTASNGRLAAIKPNAVSWAMGKVVGHYAFCTSSHKCTCGDCGHKFDIKRKGKHTRCPECGRRLEVVHTLRRKQHSSAYFSTMEAVDGMQVQRVFLLKAVYSKGSMALTSRKRNMGYYMDCFNWSSDIELRSMADVHWVISDTYVYPHYSTIPQLRRNGMRGFIPDCHPMRQARALLSDCRIETMMKARDFKAVEYFVSHMADLDMYWNAYKIARRHRYAPTDYGLWCDMVRLLDKCGRDTRSVKYICPENLKVEHDRWLAKVTAMEERRREMERLAKAKEHEKEFYATKSRYFGIVIKDGELEISVLDSIEAYKEEGDQLKHCVFKCEYYAKADSLILSAHDRLGNRIETVELDLQQGKVVQSRGICNSNTEYHDRIVKLVNDNAHLFIKAKQTA